MSRSQHTIRLCMSLHFNTQKLKVIKSSNVVYLFSSSTHNSRCHFPVKRSKLKELATDLRSQT